MALEVEILTSNISAFDDQLLKTHLSYEDFFEITETMQVGEFIKFQLLIEEEKPIYQGTFHKKNQLQTFEEDLNEKLVLLVKNKSITSLEKEIILQEIYIEVSPSETEKNNFNNINERKRTTKNSGFCYKNLRTKSILKYIGFLCVFFCFLFGIGFSIRKVFSNTQNVQTTKDSTKKESKEAQLTLNNYQSIAEKYPGRRSEVADYLASKEEFQKLASFEEVYPTEIGAFELAFNQQEWETVIQTNLSHLTDERKMMLAIAFLELGNIEEADLINQRVESKSLSKKIAIAYLKKQNISAAQKIQEEIEDENLEKIIDTAFIYQELIDHYKSVKDKDNQEIWERKFKSIDIEGDE